MCDGSDGIPNWWLSCAHPPQRVLLYLGAHPPASLARGDAPLDSPSNWPDPHVKVSVTGSKESHGKAKTRTRSDRNARRA